MKSRNSLAGDIFYTFATQSGLVYDTTDTVTDCLTQNGCTDSYVFAAFKCQFLANRTRNWVKLKCCCVSIKNNNPFLSVGPVMSLMCLCFLHSPLRDTYNYISFLCLSFSLMLPPSSVLIVLGKRKCLYICICCCAIITTDVLFVIISYSVYGHACCSTAHMPK